MMEEHVSTRERVLVGRGGSGLTLALARQTAEITVIEPAPPRRDVRVPVA
jgi:hypothetical protein